jgi:C4-dicarboxylate-specific signal transduction histidine kinase
MEPVLPGAGTLMAVPVNQDHRVLGVLEMESLKEGAFDTRLKDVLTYFAEIISLTQVISDQRLLAEENAKQADLFRTNGELHHRIANSLGIIQQSARDLELEKNLPEPARLRVGYITAHSSRIKNVLVELKDLAMPRPVTVETVDVCPIVRSVTDEWLTRSPDVAVSLSPTRRALLARADEERLRDALICLVKNSFEAIEERRPKDARELAAGANDPVEAPPKYWVRVEISEDKEFVNVTISDNGIGFDEEIGARLFNALFSTKSRRENLNQGYGLYTSERVIKAMGGSIKASSKGPYEGATFTICLLKTGE